ncbi:MAG: TonB-dependent receptor [Bacteroidales bacterium]|nr:TonB-dependent receptor [Bacteroidales bacterium]
MKKFYIIIFFLWYGFQNAQVPLQTLRGYVLDETTREPLIGAVVLLQNQDSTRGTVTDEQGNFRFDQIAVGRYHLKVSYLGYETKELRNIEVSSARQTVVEIVLSQNSILLKGVTIRTAKDEQTYLSVRSFHVEQTERYAGSLGDVARMAGNFAGVSVHNDTRNDIIIRGNSPVGLIWRLDGIEIRNPNHFAALGTTGGPVGMLNNNTLSNSAFYSGAFPARFGNGLSGVFDLKMRKGNDQKTELMGQVGFNGFELGAEGPIPLLKRSSYLINARYSTLAVMHKLGFGTGTGSAVPFYEDLTYKIFLPVGEKSGISLIGLYGDSHIDMQPDTVGSGYMLTNQRTAFQSALYVSAIQYHTLLFKQTFAQLGISHQSFFDKTILDDLDSTQNLKPFYRSRNNGMKYSLQMSFKTRFAGSVQLEYGVAAHRNTFSIVDSVFLQTQQLFKKIHNADISFYSGAAFMQIIAQLTSKLTLEPGAFMFYQNLNNETSFEPRLRLQYKLTPLHDLYLGYGLHTQMLPPQIYFVLSSDSGLTNYHTTNTNLKLTRAHHLVLGYSYLLKENLNLTVEAYYQWLYRIPVSHKIPQFSFTNIGEFFSIPAVDSLVSKGNGRNMGIELTIERSLCKGFYVLGTVSLFDSKSTGYDGKWRNTAFNNRFIFNLLGGYEWRIKEKNFLTVDVKATYAGGKPYLPIDLAESINEGSVMYDFDRAYEDRFPDYFRLDIRVGFKRNGRHTTQQWAIDLQNITNHRAIIGQTFDAKSNAIQNVYQFAFYPMMLYRIYL